MSIPVTCLECQAHFHVGDEFAGLPGRCPECAAVIQVPDPNAEPEERVDRHPYWTPRGVEAFEEMPSRSREPRQEERREPMRQHREDYAEPRPRFDPVARAAKWKAVTNGLRNLMVAVSLIAVDLLVASAFVLVDEVKGPQQAGFGPREKSLIIGVGITAGLCIVLWMWGRVGCARVPYVPARRLALPAGVIAGLTGVTGLIGMTMFICGFALAQQGNMAGFGLAGLGECALFPSMFGFVIVEVLGVWSQIRMAEGLHDLTFGRTSKVMMAVLLLLTSLFVCGSCFMVMLVMAAIDKAAQNQQFQNQQQPPPIVQNKEEKDPVRKPLEGRQPKKEAKDSQPERKPGDNPQTNKEAKEPQPGKKSTEPRPRKKDDVGPEAKDPAPAEANKAGPKKKDEKPAPPVANNAPVQPHPKGKQPKPQPQQPPEIDPEIIYGATIFSLVITLVYAGFCLLCFQSGRRAIQREIQHLVGDPHDHDHRHDGHY